MKRLFFAIALIFATHFAASEPITQERIDKLPETERAAWQGYFDRSTASAKQDADTIKAELAAAGLSEPIKAPPGGDFKYHNKPGDEYFASEEAKKLAESILSFQTPTGGWSKHIGFARGPRKPGMQWTAQNEPGEPAHYVATFDNNSTTGELSFLANIYNATKREDCKTAFAKGLKFIFAAQNPNGGWPQVYPLEGKYHDDITFNDDAMTNVLELLHNVSSDDSTYKFVDEADRKRAAEALEAGIKCVLRSQITQNGVKTVWCAQIDPITLEPSNARKMEPATMSGLESAHILEFLMSIKNPPPEVIASIEAALKWFEQAKITNISRVKKDGKTVYEVDPSSTEVYWARFYDLTTGKPVFPGRDGIIYNTFEEMIVKNKVGYDYYTGQPGSIIKNGQKKWRKMLAGPSTK